MEHFPDQESYEAWLDRSCRLPDGFRVSSGSLTFVPRERPTLEPYRMNMSMILLDEPTDMFAGMCTRNAIVGAPVVIARELLQGRQTQGVIVNNRISNVCAPDGIEDAHRVQEATAARIGCDPTLIFPVSTGIIGWKLPVDDMLEALPAVCGGLQRYGAREFAQGIMTTDRYPKMAHAEVGNGRILGIAKGAGMVEPDLATMLVFIMTDIRVERAKLRAVFADAVDRSFNHISIDSDQSTSDMALLLSSGAAGTADDAAFASALCEVCRTLSLQVVRNGEGTAHVIEVTVSGLSTESACRAAGKAVVNSPLIKTAIYGNDPNVGRIVGALGDHASREGIPVQVELLEIRIGGELVFARGSFRLDREKEITLSSYLSKAAMNPRVRGYPQHDLCVQISIDFGLGPAESTVWGSDLSDEYVHENADYRT